MTYSIVNIGATANNGLGDPLRNAMNIVNNNFNLVDTHIDNKINELNLDSYVLLTNYNNQIGSITASIALLESTVDNLEQNEHTHTISDIVGLTASLNSKVDITAYNLQISQLNSTIAALTQRIVDIENNL